MDTTITTSTAATAYSTYSKTSTKSSTTDAATTTIAEEEVSAVYEKSDDTTTSATYSVSSKIDRTALAEKLKENQEAAKQNLVDLAQKMISNQNTTFQKATNGNQNAIDDLTGDDAYWGSTQTAQRLFDFAYALAGEDTDLMQELQEAMMKGFELAGAEWGSTLPDVCYETIDKANSLFEEYFQARGVTTSAQ